MQQKSFPWSILISGFVIQLIFSSFHFTFGVFLKPVADAFGWSRGAASFAFTLSWWTTSPAAIVLGWFSDRVGARKVLIFGAVIFSLGFFLSGTIQHLWQFYLYFGLLTGIGRASTRSALLAAIIPYFSKNRGLAIGILLSGTGLGTVMFPPLVRYVISHAGWPQAFYMLAIIAAGIIIPSTYFLKSEDLQKSKAGPQSPAAGPKTGGKKGILPQPWGDWDAYKVLKSSYFWLMLLIGFTCCTSHSLPTAHVVAFATDQGVDKLKAAMLLGVMGATGVMGRLFWGALSDRIGARRTLLGCITVQTIMLFWLSGAHSLYSFVLLSGLFGFGRGGVLPMYPIINRELFGGKRFATLYAMQSVGTGLGMGAGAILGGFVFDFFGGYASAFIIAGLIGTVAITGASLLVFKLPVSAKQGLETGNEVK